ncbi:MAG: FtsW/RodA/SpoVE family cell cycle protein [Ignavibacteria bacterium]|nr:FtsW/RodA/SpoVE family cell cycle protein [Ignavibacteria bacterium]
MRFADDFQHRRSVQRQLNFCIRKDFRTAIIYSSSIAIKVILSISQYFSFAKLDYRMIQKIFQNFDLDINILLIFTLFSSIGPIKGASRWIYLGPFSFQPSELARYSIVIYIAALLARKKDYIYLLYRGYLPVIFYVLLVTTLILLQPNFLLR